MVNHQNQDNYSEFELALIVTMTRVKAAILHGLKVK